MLSIRRDGPLDTTGTVDDWKALRFRGYDEKMLIYKILQTKARKSTYEC